MTGALLAVDERTPAVGAFIDRLDLGIFSELQADGRIPFTTLADRMGCSEALVRRRVKRLLDEDVFSITAVADPRVLGLEWMAWIGVGVRPGATSAVAEQVVTLPEVDYVVQTTGGFGVMAEVACRSPADLHRLVNELRAIPGVRGTESFVYLGLVHQQFQWTLRDPSPVGVADRPGQPELEPLDRELIHELQRDGRVSFRTLAQRLEVSERLLSKRYRRLADANVVRVMAVGNPLVLGFGAMAWLGIRLSEGAMAADVSARLGSVRGIDYVVLTTGRYDLMAELVCRDRDELIAALDRQIGGIAGIEQVDTFLHLRLLYRSIAGAWGAARSMAEPRAWSGASVGDALEGGRRVL